MNDLYNFLQAHPDYELRIRARNDRAHDDALTFVLEWECPCTNRERLRLHVEASERTLQHHEREFFAEIELEMAHAIRKHTKPARRFDDGRTYFREVPLYVSDEANRQRKPLSRTHIDPAEIRRYCRPNGSSLSIPHRIRDEQMFRAR